MSTAEAHSVEDLLPHLDSWRDLAAHASEVNIFYEDWMLIPALKHFVKNDIRVVLVWSDTVPSLLIGLLPLQTQTRYWHMPAAHFCTWQHLYCYLCTPLIRRGAERDCLEQLFRWFDRSSEGGGFLEFKDIKAEGRIIDEIFALAGISKRTVCCTAEFSRPFFIKRGTKAEYFSEVLSKERMKEYRKKRRKLEARGILQTEQCSDPRSIDGWIADFLRLEAAGWKGAEGGAMATSAKGEDFFTEVVREAFSQNRLLFQRLALDGKPIAMKCSFLSGKGDFGFKIAYDENFSQYSPGLLLELDHLDFFFANADLEWADSCAEPEHPLFARLWKKDSLPVCSLLMSRPEAMPRAITHGIGMMRRAWQKIKDKNVPGVFQLVQGLRWMFCFMLGFNAG